MKSGSQAGNGKKGKRKNHQKDDSNQSGNKARTVKWFCCGEIGYIARFCSLKEAAAKGENKEEPPASKNDPQQLKKVTEVINHKALCTRVHPPPTAWIVEHLTTCQAIMMG